LVDDEHKAPMHPVSSSVFPTLHLNVYRLSMSILTAM
jgi:hypothetical protein